MSRPSIHCYVTLEAKDWWDDHADKAGVSLSALIEAIAQEEVLDGLFVESYDTLVKSARRIDATRRRRRTNTKANT